MQYPKFMQRWQTYLTLNNGVLLIALVIATMWVWSTVGAIQRNFKLQQQVDALAQEIAVHELENKTLQFQNQYYKTPEYLELSARERLNKAAPGEQVLMLPPNSVKPAGPVQPAASTETPITQRSNFAQWMYFLFGKKS